jgi:N12 class adenine-specific DNA methylase
MAITLDEIKKIPGYENATDADILSHAAKLGVDVEQPKNPNGEFGSYVGIPVLKGVNDLSSLASTGLSAIGADNLSKELDLSRQRVEKGLTGLQSEQARKDAEAGIFSNGGVNGGAVVQSLAQSIPGMAAMFLPGQAINKGVGLLLNAEKIGAKVGAIAGTGALGKGLAAGVTHAIGEGIGFGAAEGIVSGASDAAQARDKVRELPFSTLAAHPEFQKAFINETDPSADTQTRLEHARELIAQKTGDQVFKDAAIATGAIGMATGGGAFGILERGAPSILKGAAKGFATEAGQEAAQSGAEQYAINKALQENANAKQSLGEDVGKSMAEGGLVGGILGGLGGGVGGIHRSSPENKTPEPELKQSDEQSNQIAAKNRNQDLYKSGGLEFSERQPTGAETGAARTRQLRDLAFERDRAENGGLASQSQSQAQAQPENSQEVVLRADGVGIPRENWRNALVTQASFTPDQAEEHIQKIEALPVEKRTHENLSEQFKQSRLQFKQSENQAANQNNEGLQNQPVSEPAKPAETSNANAQSDKTEQSQSAEAPPEKLSQAFEPTHLTSDGVPVKATDEANIYIDQNGNEIEDSNAIPAPKTGDIVVTPKGTEGTVVKTFPKKQTAQVKTETGAEIHPIDTLEVKNAQQEQETTRPDGSGSAQSEIRQEGGNTAGSGARVRASGQSKENTQEVGDQLFKSTRAAQVFQTKHGLNETHEITKVNGGYVLTKKAETPENQPNAEANSDGVQQAERQQTTGEKVGGGQEKSEVDRIAQQYADILHRLKPNHFDGVVRRFHTDFASAIVNKNADWLSSFLHNGNQNSRKAFSEITGVALPKAHRDVISTINNWAGEQKPAANETSNTIPPANEEQSAKLEPKNQQESDIDGFLDDAKPMRKAAGIKGLNKLIRSNGKVMPIKDWVKAKLAEGYQPKTREEYAIKPMSRLQYLRATQAEQEAHDKRMKASGKKTVYILSNGEFFHPVGKFVYDYALHLKAKESIQPDMPEQSANANAKPEGYGKANKIFTEDAAAKARELLKKKLGQLNAGLDPEMLQAGMTLAGYHIEAGARAFGDYAKAMIDDLGESARPFLRSWYEGVRHYPGVDNTGMSSAQEIEQFLQNGEKNENPTQKSKTDAEIHPVGKRGSETDNGKRGRVPVDEGTASDGHGGILEAQPSENVSEASAVQPSAETGVRARKQNAGSGRNLPEIGDAVAGLPGTGRTRLANTRSRGAGRGKQRLTPESATESAEREQVDGGDQTKPSNFHLDNPESIIGGTPKQRFARNKTAIETYQRLVDDGAQPTPEDQQAIASYIGWGSFGQELFQGSWNNPVYRDGWREENDWLRQHLGEAAWKSAQASIINAHYTDPPTVQAMWDMARELGFTGGKVLEPSMGIGNFFALMPRDVMERSNLTGIEMDATTGGMAKMLYPDANIQIKPYQDSKTADDFYDLVIGNWPFAAEGPADRRYNKLSPTLHDYFFLKALDQVRPGGLVIGITSAGTMDKQGRLVRAEMAKKAHLVAAFRLPTGAFEKYAGTSVVTDIIVLQKLGEGVAPPQSTGAYLASDHVLGRRRDGTDVKVNEYWVKHPDHVLGKMTVGHGTTQGRDGMIVERAPSFAEQLAALPSRLPKNIVTERDTKHIEYISNNTDDRQNSVVNVDGKFYVVKGDQLAKLEDIAPYRVKNEKETQLREDQLTKVIAIKKAYAALIDGERHNQADVEALRRSLRDHYQGFVNQHGFLTGSFGLKILNSVDDPLYPALAALERKTANGKYDPADIFTKSTIRGNVSIANPNINDAFVLVRNSNVAAVDIGKIAELAKQPESEVIKTLTDSGAIYLTPAGNYQVRDIYLSGNVRRKLREALDARDAGLDMERNIDALKGVLPPTIPYFAIEAKMGATWVSSDHYRQFVQNLLNLTPEQTDEVIVTLMPKGWRVTMPSWVNKKPEATNAWGITSYPFNKLFNAAMNNTSIVIKGKDSDGKEYVMEEASAQANEKAAALRDEFAQWVWRDIDRRMELENAYNETMNAIAEPNYDGSFLAFNGMALMRGQHEFNLRKHQVDAIWRGVANGRGIYAHEVGTGKTLTMGGIAVESRRYGLAKKPMILAHNANSASVAVEIQQMYPGAKILYIDNLSPATIKQKMYQIANDDWDAVVLPHSLINRLALTKETLDAMTMDDIIALEEEALAAAQEDNTELNVRMMDDETLMKKVRSVTAKQLVKARNQIIKKNQEMAQRASREDSIAFEHLGVDLLIVDEAHEFKKPPIVTRMKLKGLNTATSGESLSLHLLASYIRDLNNGKGVHIFTGTPITNTLNEIYNQMRYVMADEMDEAGVKAWDAWFNTFSDAATDVELTSTGEYEATTRLSSFVNVAELRRMAGQYMDIVFADDMPEFKPREINGKNNNAPDLTDEERDVLLSGRTTNPIGRPYKKVINDIAPMSPGQKAVLEHLSQMAREFKNADKKDRRAIMLRGDERSPVIVEGNAAKAAFDLRRYDLSAEDHPLSKVNRAVRNVLEHYHEHPLATQVIFMDTGYEDFTTRTKTQEDGTKTKTRHAAFNIAKDIINKLAKAGIPREQIAVVKGSTSKEKRKEIADAMNRGEIRVVIGSTSTLGVGVNMQNNLRAMHHLDAPWMPGELEQRNGRGHRQGNQWNTVLEYRYLTEGLDGRRWQVLAIKQKFITAFLKADKNTRVIEGDAVSMDDGEGGSDIAESLSVAAGDPRLLMREKLKTDVIKLENKKRMHDMGVVEARNKALRLKAHLDRLQSNLKKTRDDALFYEPKKQSDFSVLIAGKHYTERKEADEAIKAIIPKLRDGEEFGDFRGFNLIWNKKWNSVTLDRETQIDAVPSVASIEANLRNLPRRAEKIVDEIDENQRSIAGLEKAAQTPFGQEHTLIKKRDLLKEVTNDLELYPAVAPFWLRDGAPVGTDVYVDHNKVVVVGHRWGTDNWYVMVDNGQENQPVTYTSITDENNFPVFEEIPFQSPASRSNVNQPSEQIVNDNNPDALYSKTTPKDELASAAIDRAQAMAEARSNGTAIKTGPQTAATIRKILAAADAGNITEQKALEQIAALHNRIVIKTKAKAYQTSERVRGADYIRQKLLEAKRRGDISAEKADFAEWFIKRNPALMDELGISITQPKHMQGLDTAGYYNPAARIITLIKGHNSDTTAVHEMLHHLERMMPMDLQAIIRKAWLQQSIKARAMAEKAGNKKLVEFFDQAIAGDTEGALKALKDSGAALESNYHYVNPSEFWAVNATDILHNRFRSNSSLLARLKNWMRETYQHIKSFFGLDSTAPILRAIDAVLSGKPDFQSKNMLANKRAPGAMFASFNPNDPNSLWDDAAEIPKSTPRQVYDRLRYVVDKGRSGAKQLAISALTQRQIIDIGSEILPVLKQFENQRNAYDVEESKWHQRADKLAERWENLNPNKSASGAWRQRNRLEQGRLADMMHLMTVSGIDPRQPIAEGVDQGEYDDIKAKYDKLLPNTKSLLDDVEAYHQATLTATRQSVVNKIEKLVMPKAKKDEIIKNITNNFSNINGPYFPLMRFGQYWVNYGDGVQFFESKAEQDDFIKHIKEEGGVIKGFGKSLDNFGKIEGVDAAFIDDIDALIDKLNIAEADELKDGVFQLYLSSLPEQSVRKRFIHRKKTPGWETDALRSFAKKAFHDGKQLAKMRYAPEMRDTLTHAESIVKTGNSDERYNDLVDSIDALESAINQLNSGIEFDALQLGGKQDSSSVDKFKRFSEDERVGAMSDYLDDQREFLKQVDDYRAKGDKTETAADILRGLRKSYNNMMESNTSQWTNLINQTVFTYMLGFNPSSALTNAASTPIVAMPYIGGRHGLAQASRAISQAAKDFFSNKSSDGFSIEPALKDDGERKMFDALSNNGTFDRTRSHDLAGLSEEGVERGSLHRKFMMASTYMFHKAEVANREITALAAYRLEFAKTGSVQASINYANDVVNKVHLDYSAANRPDLFQGNFARIALQFKMFSQGMTYLWGKTVYDAFKGETPEQRAEARNIFLSMTAVQIAAAGVLGLPIGGIMMAAQAIAGLFDDNDEPVDVEVEIRKALANVFGADIGRILSKGVLNETGIDLHSRMSLSDLWIREPDKEMEGKDEAYYLLKTALGPVTGILENVLVGMKLISEGNTERGVEKMLPNMISAPLKTMRLVNEGGSKSLTGNMIYETNRWEQAMQALGFKPSGLSEQLEQNSALKNREQAIKTARQRIISKAANARVNGDTDTYKEAIADMQAWNRKYPQDKIMLKSIMQSIKLRQKNARESERGIVMNKRLRRLKNEEQFIEE